MQVSQGKGKWPESGLIQTSMKNGRFHVSKHLTGEFLISWRNSESAESACCRISWLESLNILNKPGIFLLLWVHEHHRTKPE